jgi:hypothetical protein
LRTNKKLSPILTALSLKIHFLLCDDIAFWIFFQFGLLCSSGCGIYFYVLASLELIAEEIEDPLEAMKMIYQLIKLLRTSKNMWKNCCKIA